MSVSDEELRAFHGDAAIKDQYLARVLEHRERDELVQGIGYEKDETGKIRGCGIGCTLEAYEHSRYPIELGIPERLAHLEDRLFETMAYEDALAWPQSFLAAIPVGADLSRVWPQWVAWMLADPEYGVVKYVNVNVRYVDEAVAKAIRQVAMLWRQVAVGETIAPREFGVAAQVAWMSSNRWGARAAANAAWAFSDPAMIKEAVSWAALAVAGAKWQMTWAATAAAPKLIELLQTAPIPVESCK